jgi:hypothetical protein
MLFSLKILSKDRSTLIMVVVLFSRIQSDHVITRVDSCLARNATRSSVRTALELNIREKLGKMPCHRNAYGNALPALDCARAHAVRKSLAFRKKISSQVLRQRTIASLRTSSIYYWTKSVRDENIICHLKRYRKRSRTSFRNIDRRNEHRE